MSSDSTAKIAPTAETHRFMGMWRPPLETLLQKDAAEHRIRCPCNEWKAQWLVRWGNTCHYDNQMNREQSHREFLEHWLAGHFDEPQYELKSRTENDFK